MEKTNFCISLFLLISTSLCNQVDYKYEEYKNDEYNYNEYDDYSQELNYYYDQNLLTPPNPPPLPIPTPPFMGKMTFLL